MLNTYDYDAESLWEIGIAEIEKKHASFFKANAQRPLSSYFTTEFSELRWANRVTLLPAEKKFNHIGLPSEIIEEVDQLSKRIRTRYD